jgi:hypothetical protein
MWNHFATPSSIPQGFLIRAVSQRKLMENGGTEGAQRGDGPSLKKPKFEFPIKRAQIDF